MFDLRSSIPRLYSSSPPGAPLSPRNMSPALRAARGAAPWLQHCFPMLVQLLAAGLPWPPQNISPPSDRRTPPVHREIYGKWWRQLNFEKNTTHKQHFNACCTLHNTSIKHSDYGTKRRPQQNVQPWTLANLVFSLLLGYSDFGVSVVHINT